ncbi:MAG: AMP-binding protein, partial [Bacillota bacterium]|nr:AMP-binding protein [Bacillota bacterium]
KRIAVIGKNCYEWILSLLAVSYIGAVAVPLDKGLSETEIMEQMDRINADTLIFDKDYSEIAKGNAGRENICFNADEGFENIDDLLEKGYKKGILPEMDSDADKLALLLFTSGTTSKSKIVMLSQNNIIANIEDMHECEEFYDTDVNLAILPFHHTFGLTGILLFVSIGATNVFCEGLRIQKALIEYKVTVLVGVPLILDNIWHMIQRTLKKKKLTAVFSAVGFINRLCIKTGIDIRRKLYKSILDQLGGGLRCVISGAAPLNPETSAFFNSMGILTIQGYGLTETAPVIAAENPANMRLGSVGKAMPSIDIKIENAGEDNIGEIIAKGPNVMLGYYENPE